MTFAKKQHGQSVDRYHFLYICGMRNVFLIICSLLLSFELADAASSRFHWKPIDTYFDSIVNKLEKGFTSDDDVHRRDSLVNQLYAFAGKHKKELVYQWRANFWDARTQLKKNNSDSTLILIDKAYRQVDSLKYTYDYMRIRHLWTIMHQEKTHLIYKSLKEISEYYAKVNDLFMLAHAYIDMGNILNRLKDYTKALEYYRKADTYYKELNEDIYQAKNQLNISNVLYLIDEKEQADNILNKLLNNPVCVRDTSFYINTLLSLAEHDVFLNKELISEACRLSIAFANKGLLIQSECFMGNFYQNDHQPDSALYYYRKAYSNINSRHTDFLIPLLKSLSECFADLHHPDSAYIYLHRYEQHKDSLDQINSLAEIRRIESRAAIEKQESELRQVAERNRFHTILTVILCIFIICIAALICYIFWKRHREEKIKKQLKELENKELTTRLKNEALQNEYFKVELESKDRELTSNSLIIMEKNQVLKSLIEEIEKEKNAGKINPNTVVQINNNIKRHLGTNDEWEFFKVQFEKVHPDFFIKLKKQYPSITEGELRLCAYIRTGMENKHIAQMLSLQPDSIKKNRYRIRKKLGIADSLEDFLRNI